MKRTGNTPRTWNKLRSTLKRSQLRQARKKAEKARTGRNPKTGRPIKIPAARVVKSDAIRVFGHLLDMPPVTCDRP